MKSIVSGVSAIALAAGASAAAQDSTAPALPTFAEPALSPDGGRSPSFRAATFGKSLPQAAPRI